MLKTPLTDLLNIEVPVLQGGMAWISHGALAAAVSEAGGLGIISSVGRDIESLRREIAIAEAKTEKPFGVNIMLQHPLAEKAAEIVVEAGVKVVTTGAGSPAAYMDLWRQAGIKVIPVIASVAMAKRMEKLGAHAVVAEGGESGGHIGELSTMALVPQVCEAVSIPVIAAGGIGDGRGVAAALALGAVGVQMGTRFLTAVECDVHPHYKEMVRKAKDTDTIVTGRRFGGSVCRCLKNSFSRSFKQFEFLPETTAEEVNALGLGALQKAALMGDTLEGCFLAGQISGMVNKEESAAEIIASLSTETEKYLKEAAQWIR